jgi:hypothetical protein
MRLLPDECVDERLRRLFVDMNAKPRDSSGAPTAERPSVASACSFTSSPRPNLLFRWFGGMEMDEPGWNDAVFSKNRERVLNQDFARSFFEKVLGQVKPYTPDERFTVDRTLIGA